MSAAFSYSKNVKWSIWNNFTKINYANKIIYNKYRTKNVRRQKLISLKNKSPVLLKINFSTIFCLVIWLFSFCFVHLLNSMWILSIGEPGKFSLWSLLNNPRNITERIVPTILSTYLFLIPLQWQIILLLQRKVYDLSSDRLNRDCIYLFLWSFISFYCEAFLSAVLNCSANFSATNCIFNDNLS